MEAVEWREEGGLERLGRLDGIWSLIGYGELGKGRLKDETPDPDGKPGVTKEVEGPP